MAKKRRAPEVKAVGRGKRVKMDSAVVNVAEDSDSAEGEAESIVDVESEEDERTQSVLLIYNPLSGNGRAKRVCLQQVRPALERRGLAVSVVATERQGHLIELAANFDAAKFDVLGVVGGDGTFFEALNGVMKKGTRVRLALFPGGSGNDFLASVGVPNSAAGVEMVAELSVPPTLS